MMTDDDRFIDDLRFGSQTDRQTDGLTMLVVKSLSQLKKGLLSKLEWASEKTLDGKIFHD